MTTLYQYPPSPPVTVTPEPIEFVLNGVDTEVSRNTVTPSGSNPLPVIVLDSSGTPVSNPSLNYGASSGAIRTAAQIGNTTGQADFNTGAVSAQTLRVVLESINRADITAINTQVTALNAKVNDDFGVASGGVRTASLLGNASGIADFNSGAVSAQTFRVVLESVNRADITAINTQVTSLNGKVNDDFGVSSGGVRTASLLGNASGIADFNAGVVGAQTFRVVLESVNRADITAINTATSGINAKLTDDFGVSSAALRVAAQLGNATGSVDFNTGASSAQTQRVVIETTNRTNITNIDTATTALNGKVSNDFGAASGGVRTASIIGNATAVADFNSGAVSAQTLRTVLESTNRTNITNIDTATTALNGKVANDYGVSSAAVRAAAQVGNASGVADFNTGSAGAQTLRVVLEATNKADLTAINGKLPTALGQTTMANSLAVVLASNQSSIPVAPTSSTGRSYADSGRNAYASTNVTTGAWVQVIASTAATANLISIFDSSGQTLELGTGAAAAETRKAIIFPGGNGDIQLAIPSGTRISLRAISGTASTGEFDINLYS